MEPMVLSIEDDGYWVGLETGEANLYPRTTSVITHFYPLTQPPEVLALAAARGRAVHKATFLIDADPSGLDWNTVDPPLVAYLSAYQKFLGECEAHAIERECQFVDVAHGYVGTPDGVYEMRFQNGDYGESILDLKTGEAYKTHRLQTAAYEAPTRQRYHRKRPFARHCLYLKPDGGYKLEQHTSLSDYPTFLGLLQAYYWERTP